MGFGLLVPGILALAIHFWLRPQHLYVHDHRLTGTDVILSFEVRHRCPFGRTMGSTSLSWHRSTGFLARRGGTLFDVDGKITEQFDPNGTKRVSSPWLYGESDQAEPTAPWVRRGMTVDEWWSSLPEDDRADSISEAMGPR